MAKKTGKQGAVAVDIGIAEADRKGIAEGLNALLADTFSLYLKTHAFHWNVTGPMFQTLHLMFEVHYNELWTATDPIAERIRALGFPVKATFSSFRSMSSIPEAEGVPEATDMVRELVKGHEAAARTARSVFPRAEKGGDESTVDLLTQRLQIHEKTAWMLRSLLE
jgi:starvation-inducible DNA-binding protein